MLPTRSVRSWRGIGEKQSRTACRVEQMVREVVGLEAPAKGHKCRKLTPQRFDAHLTGGKANVSVGESGRTGRRQENLMLRSTENQDRGRPSTAGAEQGEGKPRVNDRRISTATLRFQSLLSFTGTPALFPRFLQRLRGLRGCSPPHRWQVTGAIG
ncbi:hypothetical protein SKAU_G00193450 [Synaphobranchus kaupii]|uniref:Uncharacterized protein n=1 Tax=Synaphobranchus kaupii TaxID=118154 RepID=A0A9Q1FE02_SYNKA|nr:hypothetical protein SKAU_G00193450 [Synaphobranchus kaupii]